MAVFIWYVNFQRIFKMQINVLVLQGCRLGIFFNVTLQKYMHAYLEIYFCYDSVGFFAPKVRHVIVDKRRKRRELSLDSSHPDAKVQEKMESKKPVKTLWLQEGTQP